MIPSTFEEPESLKPIARCLACREVHRRIEVWGQAFKKMFPNPKSPLSGGRRQDHTLTAVPVVRQKVAKFGGRRETGVRFIPKSVPNIMTSHHL